MISLEAFTARRHSRQDYLDAQRRIDEALAKQGYLTSTGVDMMQQRAKLLLDRMGMPDTSDGVPSPEQSGDGKEPGAMKPGLPKTGV